jgi:hypothetical protein
MEALTGVSIALLDKTGGKSKFDKPEHVFTGK